MRVRFAHAAVLVAATCALMFAAQNDKNDKDDTFKLQVDVRTVSLDVIVQNANNRSQTNLRQEDFQIYEDGAPQKITHFSSAETPRSTLLLFDATDVMEQEGPFMLKAMDMFLANSRQGDRVAVAAFGPEFEMLMNFRNIEPSKPVNVKLPKTLIGTNIYDALSYGAKRIKDEKGRKAIVIMSDGRETYGFNETKRLGYVPTIKQDTDFQGRLKDLAKRAVPIYFVALDTDPQLLGTYDYEYAYLKNPADYKNSAEYARGARTPTIAEDYLRGVRQRVELIAEVTGGRVAYPRNLQDVVGLFPQISRELNSSYSIGYTPTAPDDGKHHRIEVKVQGEGLKVTQSRDGYGGGVK